MGSLYVPLTKSDEKPGAEKNITGGPQAPVLCIDNHCIGIQYNTIWLLHAVFRDILQETTYMLETVIILHGKICNPPSCSIKESCIPYTYPQSMAG